MLEDVYADRKKAKKVMMDKKEDLKKIMDEIKQFLDPKIVITYQNLVKYYVVYDNAKPIERFTDEAEAIKFKLELIKLKNGNK